MNQKSISSSAGREPVDLVLGGGGVKGFGHLGFLLAVEERHINVGTITGVSIGSLIGAFYVNGYTPPRIEEILIREVAAIAQLRKHNWHLIDLLSITRSLVSAHGLQPKSNLRILAYNPVKRKPVIFEGIDYDLATAVAASSSIPGVFRAVRSQPDGLLVDGGVYHSNPGQFCERPAIISKLGYPTEMPLQRLPRRECWFHRLEMYTARLREWYYGDPENHILIDNNMPDVGGLNFSISPAKAHEAVEYGYRKSCQALDLAIRQGRLPNVS